LRGSTISIRIPNSPSPGGPISVRDARRLRRGGLVHRPSPRAAFRVHRAQLAQTDRAESDHGEAFGEHRMIGTGVELWKSSCACPSSSTSRGQTASCVVRRSAIDRRDILTLCEQACRPTTARLLVRRSLLDDIAMHRLHAEERDILVDMPRATTTPGEAFISEAELYISNGVRYSSSTWTPIVPRPIPQTRRAARADEDALPVLRDRTARGYVKPSPRNQPRAISDSVGPASEKPCYAASPAVAKEARENYVQYRRRRERARCRRERTRSRSPVAGRRFPAGLISCSGDHDVAVVLGQFGQRIAQDGSRSVRLRTSMRFIADGERVAPRSRGRASTAEPGGGAASA